MYAEEYLSMNINFNDGDKPIFLQLAEGIEDDILKDIFPEETQVPSTTEISLRFKINPATANKGVNMLVDEGIIYKQRGIGMFVSRGAKAMILKKRKTAFSESFVLPLLKEAENLGIEKEEIIALLEAEIGKNGNNT